MRVKIGGIIQNDHLARVSVLGVPHQPDTAAKLLNAFGRAGINVQFIVQCIDHNTNEHIVVCIDRNDLERALELVRHIQGELCASATDHAAHVASVGIFGPDFRAKPGIAAALLAALAAAEIHIQAISTSISTVTVVIAADQLPQAVEAIRQAFELP